MLRRLVAVVLTIVPAPEPPNAVETMPVFEPVAQKLVPSLLAAPRMLLPEKAVVIARTLGPAELLEFDRKHLRAIILEEGSPTAHVAIVARALDLPMIGRVEGALARIEGRDRIIVDADNGQAFVRPGWCVAIHATPISRQKSMSSYSSTFQQYTARPWATVRSTSWGYSFNAASDGPTAVAPTAVAALLVR